MSNFGFLESQNEYTLFASACIEAERVLVTSASMCAVGCRKALELAVNWVYSADSTIQQPYKNNLQALIHESSFRFAVDDKTWHKLSYIIKLGNLAIHSNKNISRSDAVLVLSSLFEFVEWIDYCYGLNYEERHFSETDIPQEKLVIDEVKIRKQESLIPQDESKIKALCISVSKNKQFIYTKNHLKDTRTFVSKDINEYETRKKFIDVDLKLLGWTLGDDAREEITLKGIDGHSKLGRADYILFGKNGLPLAVVEAKRTSADPIKGEQQAKLYADCLEKQYGRRPMMFMTNGFETWFWDDKSYPKRRVSSIFSKDDLQKLMYRRGVTKNLNHIKIDDKITDRYYQKEAIRAVCKNIMTGYRKSLLVMATGSGKTRTASSLTDVLSSGGYITNALFLADRKALVQQAKDDFKTYLPDMSLCNLCTSKDDKNARIVFSTYPTMLNSIDSVKTKDGSRLFTPAHFDLIIVDEAHRSIFKKYRVIFEYFDALIVGLTATPKTDIDRNTYDFFEMEQNVPTYAYDYETAVYEDHVLVPYYNIEVKTRFLEQGIKYDELSEHDKQRYEEDFTDEDGDMIDAVPPASINKFVFNQNTVDMIIQDLMTKGIKVAGGEHVGKSIIFAQDKNHAAYIIERFDKLYPQYKGTFAKRVIYTDSYAQTIINEFKQPGKEPFIVVSVDMMDTGIDVPEVLNLVFFKRVRSKTKFWQMIGRGTRLCKGLECIDFKDGAYTDKKYFYIFDYLSNFEFFREKKDGIQAKEVQSLSESIFSKRIQLIYHLQQSTFADSEYQLLRTELIDTVLKQLKSLNPELIAVQLQRQYIDKYFKESAFICLNEQDKHNLISYIAPLVYMEDSDEYAKQFDKLIYGLILAYIEKKSNFGQAKKNIYYISKELLKRITIPQIKKNIEFINTICTDDFWNTADILDFEMIRLKLRDLIKFTVDEGNKKLTYTNLTDEVLVTKEGDTLYLAYDFEDYRLKVNRYIEQNQDSIAIHKLRNNIPMTEFDYQSLADIFTKELGSEEDYHREYGDTPFGLLVRKIAKLDYNSAMTAFSEFINDESLNQMQIVFVKKIIDYIVQNGYIENVSELMKPPFDKPVSFIKLFDTSNQKKLVSIINQFKENAVKLVDL